MKKVILVASLFIISLSHQVIAQTYLSEKIFNWVGMVKDQVKLSTESEFIMTLDTRFKKDEVNKKKVKQLKIKDQVYYVTKERGRQRSIYNDKWNLVATMNRNTGELTFTKTNEAYFIKAKPMLLGLSKVTVSDSNGVIGSGKITKKNLEYTSMIKTESFNYLLMAVTFNELLETFMELDDLTDWLLITSAN